MTERLRLMLLAPLGAAAAHVLGYGTAEAVSQEASHAGHAHLSALAVVAAALALIGLGWNVPGRSAARVHRSAPPGRSCRDLAVWQSALFATLELVEAGLGMHALPILAVVCALLAQTVTAWGLQRLVETVSRPAIAPPRLARTPVAAECDDGDASVLVRTRVAATPRLQRGPPVHLLPA